MAELKQKRYKLEELLTYKAEGALRFSKQKYYENGNRAGRLLAFQLRKEQASRVVSNVFHPAKNKTVSRPSEIAAAFAAFYENLYDSPEITEKEDKIQLFFSELDLPSLSKEEAENMSSHITEQEIKEVILKLKNNKSPGTDGIPGEFYKCFKEELTPTLAKVFNYCHTPGQVVAK